MPKRYYFALCWIIIAFLGALNQPVYASTYTSSDAQLISGTSFDTDYLQLKPVNASGVSINRFSTFSVDSKPLALMNPMGAQTGSNPALIIIIADHITLANTIEIVGAAADILFLSPDKDGRISCAQCVIKNAYRITLAINNVVPTLPDHATTAPRIVSSPDAIIDINGLSAPGVMSLDVLAGEINTNGVIDLHEKANQSADGSYKRGTNGSKTIGSGTLHLYTGMQTWDYGTQTLIGYQDLATDLETSYIDGDIRAVAFKVSSAAPLNLSAKVDTRTDLLSSVRYRGQTKISQEAIALHHFRSHVSPFLNGASLRTNSQLSVKSASGLHVEPNVSIEANNAELVAKDTLFLYGQVHAGKIELAGEAIDNRGFLEADYALNAWAEYYIANHYGGEMLASAIHLQADGRADSFIRNGMRAPYTSFFTDWLPITSADLPEGVDYFDSIDHTKIGTYYTAELHKDTPPGLVAKPAETHAHIRAKRIEIKTKAFENINPYYDIIDNIDSDVVIINPELHHQMSVIAEDYLAVEAPAYIVNSSAIMGAQNSNASVHLKTGVLSNERYRVLSILEKEEYSEDVYQFGIFVDDTQHKDVVSTKVAVYSPPGLLFSMGSFEAAASDLFLNSIGYLEVMGSAKFQAGRLVDAGIANQAALKEYTRDHYVDPISDNREGNCTIDCEGDISSTLTEPKQMDSLFYVGGDAQASGVGDGGSHILDYSPFDGYLLQSVDNISSYLGVVLYNDAYANDPSRNYIYNINHTLSMNKDAGVFSIDWVESHSYDRTLLEQSAGPDLDARAVETRWGSQEFSIFDELVILIDQLVDTLVDLFNELKWWD